jgi:23S rRNA (uracil1939-C5)-methyltransferase
MTLEEPLQRRWKATLVHDALRRIGQNRVPVEEVRAPSPPLGYRNKVELSLGRDRGGRPAIGFHLADPTVRGLVDVDLCPLQTEAANRILATARDFLLPRAGRGKGWSAGRGDSPRLVLRSSRATGKVLVALRETTEPFPDAEALAERLDGAHPELAGVVRIRARSGRRGGARILPLRGRTWLSERIGGVSYRLPAGTFVQVNLDAGEMLLDLVCAGAGRVQGRSAVELYGGVGVFAMALASRGARVTVCEADVEAVRCGRRAARSSQTGNVAFVHSDVTAFVRARLQEGARSDVVVANPPRSGLGARLPEQIARLEARRVVLVSCDPATLARDTRRLVAAGFSAERAVPVDVFPQTAHVETVLSLTRE